MPPENQGAPAPQPQQPTNVPQVVQPQPFGETPSPSQQPPQPTFSPPAPEPLPKPRRWPKVGIIVLLVVVLAGGGSGYAYWNMLNNRPEKILADALSKTMTSVLDHKPATSVGSLIYEETGDNPYKVTLDFDSKFAGNNFETSGSLELEADGKHINFDGAVKTIDYKEVYIKFDNVVETANQLAASSPEYEAWVVAFMPLLQKIDGQWFRVDSESVAQAGLSESSEKIDHCTEAVKDLRLSPDDQEAVKDIFARNQFAIATEKLESQAIDGEDSYHYKLDLNEEASIKFSKELVELPSFRKVKEDCEIKQEDFDRDLENLHKDHEDQEDEPKPVIELWVGAETRLPTKLRVKFDDKMLTSTFDTTIKINAQGVRVDRPEDALNFEDLAGELQTLSATINRD